MRAPGGLGLTEDAIRLLQLPKKGKILDIGCGEGETVRFLAQRGFDASGVDSDPTLASDRVQAASAAALPFGGGEFDAALFECSFSKVELPEAAIRECRRVLKPGGRVAVADLYARGVPGVLGGFLGRVEKYEDIKSRVESLGFREVHFEDRSGELMSLWSSLVFENGAEALIDEIGASPADLKRIKCGYFLAVFEKTPEFSTDSWIYTLTGAHNAEELRDWQLGRIRGQLTLAKKSRFYAGRFGGIEPADIRSFADFERLPLTEANDFAGREIEFLCVGTGDVSRIVTQPSSGTSGLRKRMSFTECDVLRTEEFFTHALSDLMLSGGRVTVFMSNAAEGGIGDLLRRALARVGCETVIHGNVSDLADAAQAARGSALLVGFPHEMRALSYYAPDLRPELVMLSADYIPQNLAKELVSVWGCRVIRHFGMTETCFGGAVDCPTGGGQHIRHADFYFEILDPATLRPLPAGTDGELVITTLRSEAMPLIRYRTGDIARLEVNGCACGGVFPRLGNVLGRTVNLKNRMNIHALDEFMYAREGLVSYGALFENGVLRLSVEGEPPSTNEIGAAFGVFAVVSNEPSGRDGKPGAKRRIIGAPAPPPSFGAVIAAAGRSSRMGGFKPLFPLGNSTVIEVALDKLRAGGVTRLVVVLGREAERLRAAVAAPDVLFAENRDYETTDMLSSIKMGLRAAGGTRDYLFFMPVDTPLFDTMTLEKMKEAALHGGYDAVVPVHRGRSGHPLLLSKSAAERVLAYEGEGGLGGALKSLDFNLLRLECGDYGILPDADSPKDYALMRLLHGEGVSGNIVRHERAVARLAARLAEDLNARGYSLDVNLVELAALVHDCARTEARHDERGAEILREMGRDDLAKLVRWHMLPEVSELEKISEITLLYLADKLFISDKPATLRERFLARLEQYEDEGARRAILKKYETAKKVTQMYEAALGYDLDTV